MSQTRIKCNVFFRVVLIRCCHLVNTTDVTGISVSEYQFTDLIRHCILGPTMLAQLFIASWLMLRYWPKPVKIKVWSSARLCRHQNAVIFTERIYLCDVFTEVFRMTEERWQNKAV